VSWTYSGDPSLNDKDTVRFLIGDTDTDEQQITDEEINFLLTTWAAGRSMYYVAAQAADAIAARYAREASYSADGTSVSLSDVQAKFAELAVRLRAQHQSLLVGGIPDVGGIDPYEQTDPTIANFIFGTGMHDDLDAGAQDFGHRGAVFSPENEPGV
jgi:hypothetical protein